MRLIDADKLSPYGSAPLQQDDGFRTADHICGIIKKDPTKDCWHWIERNADGIEIAHVCWVDGSIQSRNHCCSCGEKENR